MFDSKKLPQLMYALHTIIVQMKSEATQTNHRELADFLKTFEDLPLLLASNQDETEAIRQLIINAVQVDCMSTRALDAFDEEEPPLLKLGQIERDAMIREDKYRHAMYALHVFFVSMENMQVWLVTGECQPPLTISKSSRNTFWRKPTKRKAFEN